VDVNSETERNGNAALLSISASRNPCLSGERVIITINTGIYISIIYINSIFPCLSSFYTCGDARRSSALRRRKRSGVARRRARRLNGPIRNAYVDATLQ
jgi:hypothetical protein